MLKWLSGILTTVLSGWILHGRFLHRLRSWSWHFLNSDISQRSVVTQLKCGEIISQRFVAHLLMNLSMKQIWKSVNIWRSYGQYCSALFFWLTLYNVIYDISQGIIAVGFRPAETSMTLLQIYCLVCFERILKIAQYQTKLQERKLTA